MRETLDAYREPFKAVVLQHLQGLPTAEWQRLRAFAANQRRYVNSDDVAGLAATPAELLDAALSEDGLSVNETLAPFDGRAVEIGTIEGQPVRYIAGEGIYLWGKEPRNGFTLSLWVTHPAYPPTW